MTLSEFKAAYKDDLTNTGKTAFAKAFISEFGFKSTESFRGKLQGRQKFLKVELDWAVANIDKYKVVES